MPDTVEFGLFSEPAQTHPRAPSTGFAKKSITLALPKTGPGNLNLAPSAARNRMASSRLDQTCHFHQEVALEPSEISKNCDHYRPHRSSCGSLRERISSWAEYAFAATWNPYEICKDCYDKDRIVGWQPDAGQQKWNHAFRWNGEEWE